MNYIIHASNVHRGGGKALLLPLLEALKAEKCTVILDERLDYSKIPSHFNTVVIPPTLYGRLNAELCLKKLASSQDTVLCFGNLPPLLEIKGKVFVFLQSRYMFGVRDMRKFSFRVYMRLLIERLWFRFRLKKNMHVIVQTPTVARELKKMMGRSSSVVPFVETSSFANSVRKNLRYDFVYVATGEPHKNHKRLIKAWRILSLEGINPSLCLTISSKDDPNLTRWLSIQISEWNLSIENVGNISSKKITQIYAESGALIYPSVLESFGLPLIESKAMGLPIIAAELDYVRDVVEPAETFDPFSEVSIARAIKRHLNIPEKNEKQVKVGTLLDVINKGNYDFEK